MTVIHKIIRRWTRMLMPFRYESENVLRCWCGGSLGTSRSPLVGECQECGTGVLLRRLTEASYDRWYASGDYRRYVMGSAGVSLEQLLKELRRSSAAIRFLEEHGSPLFMQRFGGGRPSLLDIGCGAGGWLIAAKIAGVGAILGVDTDPRSQRIPKEFGITVSPYMPAGGRFDRVICSHLIEHILSPVNFLRMLAMHLTDRGVLYVETPAWGPKAEIKLPHPFMYTKESFCSLAKRAGVTVFAMTDGIQAVLRRTR